MPQGTTPDCYYALATPDGEETASRYHYLTEETAAVLFQRATWFRLTGKIGNNDPERDQAPSVWETGLEFELVRQVVGQDQPRRTSWRILAPQLVLFEATPAITAAMRHPSISQERIQNEDCLSSGMLIVDVVPLPPTQEKPGVSAPCWEDQLALNELFRFVFRPWVEHSSMDPNTNCGPHCYGTVLANVPILLTGGEGERNIGEALKKSPSDASVSAYLLRWENLLRPQLCWRPDPGMPVRWFSVVSKESRMTTREWVLKPGKAVQKGAPPPGNAGCPDAAAPSQLHQSGWMSYADSRAFVWTCQLVEECEGANPKVRGDLTAQVVDLEDLDCGNDLTGLWVKTLNVDSPSTHWELKRYQDGHASNSQVTAFERRWAASRTLRRWKHWGTHYGFSAHSGAMLGMPCENPPTWRHFAEMYFDQEVLLLYLRISLFRLSLALTRISARARDRQAAEGVEEWQGESIEEWKKAFSKLRWQFNLLANLYQYPLISNQQQGLEFYELQRRALDLNELYTEVKAQIAESYEFLESTAASDTAEYTKRLTTVATAGIALSLAVGFLGTDSLQRIWAGAKGDSGVEIVALTNTASGIVATVVSPQDGPDGGIGLLGLQLLIFLAVATVIVICVVKSSGWLTAKFDKAARQGWLKWICHLGGS